MVQKQVRSKKAYSWAAPQLKSALRLYAVLGSYNHDNDRFPDNLEELVVKGYLAEEELQRLKFRRDPSSSPQQWVYFSHQLHDEVILLSPDALASFGSGEPDKFVICRVDGSVSMLSSPTKAWYPSLFQESK